MTITASPQDHISLATPGDYFELMKPRVMRLVVFTALTGMLLAPGEIDIFTLVLATLAIAVGAGASGALNMWYDADIDAVMTRTIERPVPSKRVLAGEALGFGLVMSVLSVMTLGVLTNWTAGFWLGFTIFFYAVVYTMWLKRSTPQNIVIGGAAGAFPPMIGWAVTTGSVGIEAIVLFAIIFIWTPPHFWALALWKMGDYDNAHVPMMPNVKGVVSTRRQMLAYAVLLAPLSVAPWMLGFASPVYGAVAAVLGMVFLFLTYRVWAIGGTDPKLAAEKRLFAYSIFYLFAIFAALLIEALIIRSGVLV